MERVGEKGKSQRYCAKYCKFKVLKEICPFSFMKNVRTHECRLCLAEKSAIVEARLKGKNLINDNSEIYGPCRHISKFHRFPSTEERGKAREKDKIHKNVTVRNKRLKAESNKGKGKRRYNSIPYWPKRSSAGASRISLCLPV